MKLKKALGSLLVVFALGTGTAMAQTPQAPAPTQQIEVTDAELTEFAQIFQQVRVVNQQAQQEMIEVVQEEDFELQRFNEIHQAKMNPEKEAELTEKEEKRYALVVAELETIQPKFQKKMQDIISESDLSMERYQQLAMALRSNPELQQRLQAMMKS